MFKPENVEAYVTAFTPDVQEKLQLLRSIIRKHAPYAEEMLNYRIPAYKQDGILLVNFCVVKKHISFNTSQGCIDHFRNDLAPYKCVDGAIQFPLERKLPVQLLTQIVKFRVLELAQQKLSRRK